MAIEFNIQESKILKGVYIITPNKFRDLRGEIWTAFTSKAVDKLLPSELKLYTINLYTQNTMLFAVSMAM